jgi:RNA polymerase sigma-70 factor (ECF subfamily)
MNDEEIIERVLAGDVDCFGQLVDKYHKKVLGLIFNMTRDHHLSEDLGQDVFMDVYKSLKNFDSARSRFSTWLYRIAQNKTLNAIKKHKPLFFAEPPERPTERTAHQNVVAGEFHAELDRILDRLPIRQRLAFVWSEIEQLSYKEIAEIEGVSLGTVKSRISRARQSIQQALQNRKASSHE